MALDLSQTDPDVTTSNEQRYGFAHPVSKELHFRKRGLHEIRWFERTLGDLD
jgi:hypothetical protein